MIPRVETGLSNLNRWVRTPQAVGTPVPTSNEIAKKSIGEVTPQIVNPADYPDLMNLLTQYGVISRIRRKLMTLSGRKGNVVLAKNTVGAADNKGFVYLGVDFLKENQGDTAVIAGVMAHEWGHLVSNLIKHGYDHLTWDELFEIRREDEAAADSFCGRNLPLMGYSVEPIVRFLMQDKDKLGSHKYYKPEVRADIIRRAAQTTQQRQNFSKRLFNSSVYSNPYTSILIVA
jgi:hypothetical protein